MDSNYVFLCGVMWRKYHSSDARSELLRALGSNDQDIVLLAMVMLEADSAQA